MNDQETALYKAIGCRIREARLKLGMSQAALAERSRISLPHISDVELGKKKMQVATFIRIAEALQISTDELLRPDIPEVRNIYSSELAEALEADSILKIVRQLKETMKHPAEE